MHIKLLNIATPSGPPDGAGPISVSVTVDVDGVVELYIVDVHPGVIPELSAGLIAPGPAMADRFRESQFAMNRICALVGQQLRGQLVELPRQIAA